MWTFEPSANLVTVYAGLTLRFTATSTTGVHYCRSQLSIHSTIWTTSSSFIGLVVGTRLTMRCRPCFCARFSPPWRQKPEKIVLCPGFFASHTRRQRFHWWLYWDTAIAHPYYQMLLTPILHLGVFEHQFFPHLRPTWNSACSGRRQAKNSLYKFLLMRRKSRLRGVETYFVSCRSWKSYGTTTWKRTTSTQSVCNTRISYSVQWNCIKCTTLQ